MKPFSGEALRFRYFAHRDGNNEYNGIFYLITSSCAFFFRSWDEDEADEDEEEDDERLEALCFSAPFL